MIRRVNNCGRAGQVVPEAEVFCAPGNLLTKLEQATGDSANCERLLAPMDVGQQMHFYAARQVEDSVDRRIDHGSLLYLQEALYLERKYKEAIAQGNVNYARFSKLLGPQNQLTLSALTMRGETEGAMEDYADSIRDELAISTIARSLPGGAYLAESNLSDVAAMECRTNHIDAGIAHARQVLAETGKGTASQPVFVNAANLTLAECMIIRQESQGHKTSAEQLAEANRLLANVSIETMAQTPGLADVEGNVDTARARLALLEGRYDSVKQFADKAAPYLTKPDADPYERRAVARVKAALAAHG